MTAVLTIEALQTPQCQLHNLNLNAGEITFLSGDSGSGKSRLLRALADLDEHPATLLLDTQHKNAIEPSVWRQQVMLLPAISQWWFDTAAAHFTAVEKLHLSALNLPERLLNAPIHELSTGEKQRFALLRAMEQQPRVLLLDEPTAALDIQTTLAVETLIAQYIAQGASALWVSHDPIQIKRLAQHHWHLNGTELKVV